MKFKKIEKLIIKYVCSSANSEELDILTNQVKDPANDRLFKKYAIINFAINRGMNKYDSERSKKMLLKRIRSDKTLIHKLKIKAFAKYAAVAILFLALGYYYQGNFIFEKDYPNIEQPKNYISLEIDGDTPKTLSEFQSTSISDASGKQIGRQEGNELIYQNAPENNELYYNTLSIPYGKQFSLSLPDGTKIHLNAGSSIKFPNKFLNVGNREVFLIGEAFFDVAKDSLRPFIVNTEGPSIRVFGTKFNVSAYPNEPNINTVLVEGSVGISQKGKSLDNKNISFLDPGYMASWKRSNAEFSYKAVDTYNYTAWTKGKIVFNHIPFRDIIKKLERHYNVKIINQNQELDKELFTASFDIETIEEVLNAFDKSYPINFIRVKDQIIIN